MTLFTASLYLLCLTSLLGSALYVFFRSPSSRLNAYYAVLALALLGWVGTLFVYGRLPAGHLLLLVGRANFAAAALVATASFLFVAELAAKKLMFKAVIWLEAALLIALTLFTSLIDRAETVLSSQHSTVYGPLFAFYAIHVVAYLAGAVLLAFRSLPTATARTRPQLRLVGSGILATAIIGIVADILLPYGLGDFRFIDAGPLSTILFLLAMGYAVFAAHLFSLRLIIRAAFIYAGLITLMLELYSLALSFLARLLPLGDAGERAFAATSIALVINAFTQQPVRRWLERTLDDFSRRRADHHRTHPVQKIETQNIGAQTRTGLRAKDRRPTVKAGA